MLSILDVELHDYKGHKKRVQGTRCKAKVKGVRYKAQGTKERRKAQGDDKLRLFNNSVFEYLEAVTYLDPRLRGDDGR